MGPADARRRAALTELRSDRYQLKIRCERLSNTSEQRLGPFENRSDTVAKRWNLFGKLPEFVEQLSDLLEQLAAMFEKLPECLERLPDPFAKPSGICESR